MCLVCFGVSTQIPSSSLVNAGTSGTSGINGLPGDNGTSGVNGADGTSGINGLPGDNGTSGVNGVDGTSGVNGADGDNGTSGVNGADGTSGVNGADGTSGVSPLLSPYTGSVDILGDVAIDGTLSSTAVAQLTASWAENAISSSHSLIADLALNAKEIFVTAKNVSGDTIPKGTAVHSNGVTGENVNIVTASYDDPNLMPAIGITQTDINANGNGEVILTGRLIGFDTTGLVAGDNVYVNGTGALTATRPTGSSLVQNIGIAAKIDATDGEVIVLGSGRSNDVPNILEGYAWVGDSDGVAQPVATSSFAGSGAGFPFVGDAEITGSLGVSGSISITTGSLEGVVVDILPLTPNEPVISASPTNGKPAPLPANDDVAIG